MDIEQARAILGLATSDGLEAARQNYRLRAQLLHPDRHHDSTPAARRAAADSMAQLNQAMEVLEESFRNGVMPPESLESAPELRPPGASECLICGCFPARPIELQKVQGYLIWHKKSIFSASLCRVCGTAMFRDVQSATMAAGWWAPLGFFLNIVAVLKNVLARNAVLDLPVPAGRDDAVVSLLPAPLPVGPPVGNRPKTYLALAAWGLAAMIVAGTIDSSQREPENPVGDGDSSYIGSCWDLQGASDLIQISCDHEDADYRVTRVVDDPYSCLGDSYIRTPSGRAGCLVDN